MSRDYLPGTFYYSKSQIHYLRGLLVTVHTPLFREVFWHEYAKIPLPQAIWNEFWLRYCERSGQ